MNTKFKFGTVDHEPSVQKGHLREEEGLTPGHLVRLFHFLLLPSFLEHKVEKLVETRSSV
jgi:hypothetical protein